MKYTSIYLNTTMYVPRFTRNIFVVLALCIVNSIYGQVRTTIYPIDAKPDLSEIIPRHVADKPKVIHLLPPNVDSVLQMDRENPSEFKRVGILMNKQFSVANGEFFPSEPKTGYSNWKLTFTAPRAKSFSFRFSKLILPPRSEMYIYGLYETMVMGPITSDQVVNKYFATDVVYGDEVTMEIIVPDSLIETLDIEISNVIYGIKEHKNGKRGYRDSEWCNNDIQCSSGWTIERDAVCKIYDGTTELATGALITTDCYDLTPYILTAEHSVVKFTPTQLHNNAIFRFNYYSPTCNGPEPTSWISFTGAVNRAHQELYETDFALLELDQSIVGIQGLAMLGWNILSAPDDANVTAIHHPRGDVMKISFDNDGLGSNTFNWIVESWDDGTAEPGSSGGVLLDNDRRIIGQLRSGDTTGSHCSTNGGSGMANVNFGRFDVSWDAGAQNRRLRDWLGGTSYPSTTNSFRVPYILGTNTICTSNSTINLINPIPARSTSWSVSPTSLFASSTSGSGPSATLRAASSSTKGWATLTFTLSTSGCDPVILTKTLWVGKPKIVNAYVNGGPVQNPNVISNPAGLSMSADGNISAYTWSIASGSGSIYPLFSSCVAYAYPYVSIRDRATNLCGYTDQMFYLYNSSSPILSNPDHQVIHPGIHLLNNPTNGIFTLQIDDQGEQSEYSVWIKDQYNRLITSVVHINQIRKDFDLSPYASGVYFVTIKMRDKFETYKVLKL